MMMGRPGGRPIFVHAPLLPSAEAIQIMSMPAAYQPVTSIEELLALPDDGMRHEFLDGVHVVTPAPRLTHQRVVTRILSHLLTALTGREDAEVFSSPADVRLGPRTLVQPDVFVVCRWAGRELMDWSEVGVPLIAIEVLSDSTAARDRGQKRRIYQQAGVGEYWIIDMASRLVERWRPDDTRPEIAAETLGWTLPGGAANTLDVQALFRP
jgi:Uma2 family endonuclease